MAKSKSNKLANLELLIKATDADGDEVVMTTTPSMWMLADEWVDTMRARGNHSEVWLMNKVEQAIWLQCMIENGLLEPMPINLASIGTMLNAYDVESIEAYDQGDSEDPMTDEREGDPELE